MNQDKWTEIDIKLAFQEKAIKDQSAVIYQQQKRLDALEKSLKSVKDRMKASADFSSQQEIPDEKPPHY